MRKNALTTVRASALKDFMAKRPRIGITSRLELETGRFYLGRDYSEGVEALGGIPLMINLIPNAEYIAEVVSDLDGILLPGSNSDTDPAYYGEDPHPKLGRVVPEKDETDRLVLAEAEKRDLPVFGICFGMQALNVYRGGSLIQDIESQVKSPLKHDQEKPLARNSHELKIEKGSRLAAFAKGIEKVSVNSHHHQAVKKVGENLRATAWTNDGVIECIEDTRKGKFVVGVQWHPELSWKTDRLSGKLFEEFLAACVAKKA